MKATSYRYHAKAAPLEALAFRGASHYEPALEGLTRAYITKNFMEERERAGRGINDLVRASMARLECGCEGKKKWSYTKKHSVEVAHFVYVMAKEAQRHGEADAERLDPMLAFAGGLIHDIGKTFLPIAIVVKELGVDFLLFTLFKNTRLNDAEKRIMRDEHIQAGTSYVRLFGAGEHIRMMLDMVGLHHVMFNGKDSGVPSYPSLLRGADLPLHARIAKAADFISAVMPRHYRTNGYISSIEGALAYAITVSGIEIDPVAVRYFMSGFYDVSPEHARGLVERLAHPLGAEGVRDIHSARLYSRDIVMGDGEYRQVIARQDDGKRKRYEAELASCFECYGIEAALPWVN